MMSLRCTPTLAYARSESFMAAQKSASSWVCFHRKGRGGGLAYNQQNRVTVSMAHSSLPRAIEVLLHELTHKAVGTKHGHNDVFNRGLRRAAEHLWPWLDLGPKKSERGYALSNRLVVALRARPAEDVLALLGLSSQAPILSPDQNSSISV